MVGNGKPAPGTRRRGPENSARASKQGTAAQTGKQGAAKPRGLSGDLRNLPAALAPLVEMPHWVVWNWEWVENKKTGGKWTKVPYQPTGRKAKNNDPATWSTYAAAMAAVDSYDGIGFCLLNSGLAAFDIDACRDRETGVIHPWAQALVDRVASYTEITVSGTGLRIIGRSTGANLQRKQQVKDGVSCEAYRSTARYIVMTGNPLPGAPQTLIGIDQHIDSTVAELDAAAIKASPNKKVNGTTASPPPTEDEQPPATDDELDDMIRRGSAARFGGDRSKEVWHVINEMLRRGQLAKKIIATLLDPANGISGHVRDHTAPMSYAKRQVEKAAREIDFQRDDHGKPRGKSQSNVRIAMLKMGVTIRYDQFADRVLVDGLKDFGPALDDAALDRMWLQFDQRFRFQLSKKELLLPVVQDTARLNGFHPVRDYLASLRWDGTPRIDTWLTQYAQAEDTEYTRAVGALLLTAAVRRVRRPGSKFDELVVFESDQGTNKSSALRLLAVHEEWFADDLPLNANEQKVIEQLRGRWIVEAAELSGMRRTDIEHLKAFLSREIDRARMAYHRLVTEVPRQCVIVGTTNSEEYLRDTTGNRRFWPVRVQRFDLDALSRDRDQLWAEAAAREADGVSIRLDQTLWSAAAEQQAGRVTQDPYFEQLRDELGDRQGKIRAAHVWVILDVTGAQRSQEQNNRVGTAMRMLGWQRPGGGVARFAGEAQPQSAYIKGPQPWREIHAQRDREYGLSVTFRDELPV